MNLLKLIMNTFNYPWQINLNIAEIELLKYWKINNFKLML